MLWLYSKLVIQIKIIYMTSTCTKHEKFYFEFLCKSGKSLHVEFGVCFNLDWSRLDLFQGDTFLPKIILHLAQYYSNFFNKTR